MYKQALNQINTIVMNKLFEKLIDSKLSPEEFREIKQRFNVSSNEELLGLFLNDQENDGDTQSLDGKDIPDATVRDLKSRIDDQIDFIISNSTKFRFRVMMQKIAVVLLPICLGVIGWMLYDTNANKSAYSGFYSVSTRDKETSTISLTDSTEITLYGKSTLSFRPQSDREPRHVAFSGEAYFEVAKDHKRPFVIDSPYLTITVHGTKFNLLARAKGKYSEISLDEGTVTVKSNDTDNQITIHGGQRAIFDKQDGEFEVRTIRDVETPARSSGELFFDNASPAYLIDRLEQNYDTKIPNEARQAIKDNFSGVLPADDLQRTLMILGKTYGF